MITSIGNGFHGPCTVDMHIQGLERTLTFKKFWVSYYIALRQRSGIADQISIKLEKMLMRESSHQSRAKACFPFEVKEKTEFFFPFSCKDVSLSRVETWSAT